MPQFLLRLLCCVLGLARSWVGGAPLCLPNDGPTGPKEPGW
jgi:hypothetical protein